MIIPHSNPVALAKRIVYLAWQASNVVGLGILQVRDNTSEDSVWESATGRRDYGGMGKPSDPNEVYCDYVDGRMMKMRVSWDSEGVTLHDATAPRSDYQSWARTYSTYDDLAAAAVESLMAEASV